MDKLIRIGWLILAYLCFSTALQHLVWYQDIVEAEVLMELERVKISKRRLEMAEWKFQNDYTQLPSEDQT